jgi:raffinose/stachyose/melibiose transport system substrate-binding protein
MLWYSHILAGLGGPDVWEKPLSDPVYIKAAEILLQLFQNGNTTNDAIGADASVSAGHYTAEETAIFINGPWYIGRIKNDAPKVYSETEIAATPAFENGYAGGQIGFLLSNLAAAATDIPEKKDAVVKFLRWMTAPENVKRLSMESGSLFAIPFTQSANDNIDPLQAKFINALNKANFVIPPFSIIFDEKVISEFGRALALMILEDITPEEFVGHLIKANTQ